MRRADSLEKTLMLGKTEGMGRRGTTEGEMAGWHHQLSGHEFEQTLGESEGQGILVCWSPRNRRVLATEQNGVKMQSCWGRVGSNLIWTVSLWKGGIQTQRHTHREHHVSTKTGMRMTLHKPRSTPKLPENYLKLGERHRTDSPS